MIGIVLWCDSSKNRAVIWCEDHGDLAFYRPLSSDDTCLHKGDCVTFTLEQSGDLRRATDLVVLEQESHSALAACLAETGLTDAKADQFGVRFGRFAPLKEALAQKSAADPEQMGQIIPFPAQRSEPRRATSSAGEQAGKVVFF